MVSFPTQGGTKLTQEQILFFEESYTKYYRMMVQTVLPIVGSRDIAEDIVADTFLILLAKINSVMEHEQPVKWLFRVPNTARSADTRPRRLRKAFCVQPNPS